MRRPLTLADPHDEVAPTLGARLQRIRLQRRVAQLDLVLRHYRGRAENATGTERAGLHRSIDDFDADLQCVRAQLDLSRRKPDSRAG